MADELNFQLPPQGFDSYTFNVLPFDQGILAGAFSVAMQQIRNIQSVELQQFAQVAYSMESMAGLPFIAGTDVPTDLGLATFAKSQTALGSGVYGTFTNSNFFGCMSGLPYPLKSIYEGIKQLETDLLKTIYQNLYLAVTWNPAVVTVNVGGGAGAYTVSLATTMPVGGGYGREGAGTPTVTVDGATGITATATIGTNPDDLSTYGKITNITFSGTSTTLPSGTLTIQSPPTTHGSAGWSPGMNDAIQYYVTAADAEILAIKTRSETNFRTATILDTNWNITGTALKQEQRARYNFAPPVPIPYDRWLTVAPVALYVFVDSIPDLSKKTLPHMAAQTLEHISNLKNTGGESIVGMMRQERNQERLQEIGIELDNNIPDRLTDQQIKMLMSNGTLPGAVEGVPSLTGIDYTLPANPAVEIPISGSPCDGNVVTEQTTPEPVAVFDANFQVLREITSTKEGNISAILENTCLGPFGNGTGPALFGFDELPPGLPPPTDACGAEVPADPTPCVDDNGLIPNVVVNPLVPAGDLPISDFPTSGPPTSGIPDGINLQPPVSILPPTLNTAYTGTTLIPSTYNVPDAIDKVIECNCDCWIG